MERRCQKLEVGDALFQSKLREFSGFGEDLLVLPAHGLHFFAEWELGKLHGSIPLAQIMPHIGLKKMWKSPRQEPK